MLAIGADAHNGLHVVAAMSAVEEQFGCWQGGNSEAGWSERLTRAKGLGARRWGVEGAWNDARGLAQYQVGAGETVDESNPRRTAASRRRTRKAGTSDERDARAIAADCAVFDALATERDDALAGATRLRHQLLLQHAPAETA